jgi:hypothetical protein
MKPPILLIYEKLNNSLLTDLIPFDNIFLYDIPEEKISENIEDLIRINEISDTKKIYSSNKSTEIHFEIQIDIWSMDLERLESEKQKIEYILEDELLTRTFKHTEKDSDLKEVYRTILRFTGKQFIQI